MLQKASVRRALKRCFEAVKTGVLFCWRLSRLIFIIDALLLLPLTFVLAFFREWFLPLFDGPVGAVITIAWVLGIIGMFSWFYLLIEWIEGPFRKGLESERFKA